MPIKNIPEYLYRGDKDPRGVRKLRSTIPSYLETNLCDGGYENEIFKNPLKDLINRHIKIGWAKTHFLSFTECEDIAFNFGTYCEIEKDVKKDDYEEYEQSDKDWDFVIVTIDTKKVKFTEIEKGIYKGNFSPIRQEFLGRDFEIYLINPTEALEDSIGFDIAKSLAKKDEEWLILPFTYEKIDQECAITSKLDGGCFSNCWDDKPPLKKFIAKAKNQDKSIFEYGA
jgi:hypothetical protein